MIPAGNREFQPRPRSPNRPARSDPRGPGRRGRSKSVAGRCPGPIGRLGRHRGAVAGARARSRGSARRRGTTGRWPHSGSIRGRGRGGHRASRGCHDPSSGPGRPRRPTGSRVRRRDARRAGVREPSNRSGRPATPHAPPRQADRPSRERRFHPSTIRPGNKAHGEALHAGLRRSGTPSARGPSRAFRHRRGRRPGGRGRGVYRRSNGPGRCSRGRRHRSDERGPADGQDPGAEVDQRRPPLRCDRLAKPGGEVLDRRAEQQVRKGRRGRTAPRFSPTTGPPAASARPGRRNRRSRRSAGSAATPPRSRRALAQSRREARRASVRRICIRQRFR